MFFYSTRTPTPPEKDIGLSYSVTPKMRVSNRAVAVHGKEGRVKARRGSRKPLVPTVTAQHCLTSYSRGPWEDQSPGGREYCSSFHLGGKMKPGPLASAVLVHLLKDLRGMTCFLKRHCSPPPQDPSSTWTLYCCGCRVPSSLATQPDTGWACPQLCSPFLDLNVVIVAIRTYMMLPCVRTYIGSYKQNSSDWSGGQGEGKTS